MKPEPGALTSELKTRWLFGILHLIVEESFRVVLRSITLVFSNKSQELCHFGLVLCIFLLVLFLYLSYVYVHTTPGKSTSPAHMRR
jgi:hypothetical protein